MYWSVVGLKEWVRINILNYVIFPAKIQISKPIDVPYIHVSVWFKDDKHVIWMWIWLILKNISLLDRIWSLWLILFAHSPTNFIFWLDRLIFSVSINSHSDSIYISIWWLRPSVSSVEQYYTIDNLCHEDYYIIYKIQDSSIHCSLSFMWMLPFYLHVEKTNMTP